MALHDSLGISDLGISGEGILQGLGTFAKFIIVVILVGSLLGFWLFKRNTKKLYTKKIHLFEEVNNQFIPTGEDIAVEMTIPNTTVKVFFLKKANIYLPRGTIQMGKDHYWYGIRKNREWVNFSISNLNEEMKIAKLEFDHSDMRYANAQLKRLIERNYKKQKWWQEWRSEISVAVLILLLTVSFFLLLGEIKDIVGSLSPLMDSVNENYALQEKVLGSLDRICSQSGIR